MSANRVSFAELANEVENLGFTFTLEGGAAEMLAAASVAMYEDIKKKKGCADASELLKLLGGGDAPLDFYPFRRLLNTFGGYGNFDTFGIQQFSDILYKVMDSSFFFFEKGKEKDGLRKLFETLILINAKLDKSLWGGLALLILMENEYYNTPCEH